MKIYRDPEIDMAPVLSARVAVIGFGNQGHAHALNLRDSGVAVLVGARPDGAAFARAQAQGFDTRPVGEAAAAADWVMLTLPDEVIPALYQAQIAPALKPGATLGFAHGLVVHFGQIQPPPDADVFLIAPKGAGRWLRQRYVDGSGLACLAAVYQEPSGTGFAKALAYAGALGCGRAGILETSFRDECVTDLFGEQAVLCGGLPALLQAGYETLVAAGYPDELAYFECVQEAKLIVDLIAEGGFEAMRQAISNTAEFGGYGAGARLVDAEMKARMAQILADIDSGRFAQQLRDQAGGGQMAELRAAHQAPGMEAAGRFVRGMDRPQ